MNIPFHFRGKPDLRRNGRLVALLLAGWLAACGPAPLPEAISDPNEANNREIHAFNRSLDRALLRPAARGYGTILPPPVQTGIANVASNLDLPGDVANNLLQGRIPAALENTLRFAVNTVAGIGGIFDPATAMGLPGKPTDFGETLHLYGVGEGNYVELPGFGPTTERDLVGNIVDVALNPVRLALPSPENHVATVAKIGSTLGERNRFSDTVDSILYESVDSYVQTRLLYLQSRRFQLGQTGGEDAVFIDPYEDIFGD